MLLWCVEQVLFVQWGGYISGREHNWKLKFSMHTHLPHINIFFKYCLNNLDILYLQDGNVYRPVLKNKTPSFFRPARHFMLDA